MKKQKSFPLFVDKDKQQIISRYRKMVLFAMFDMPTDTAEERKAYRKFRKFLLSEGFIMHQYSVYSKLLLNNTANTAMIGRLKGNNPKKGKNT